MTTQRGMEGLSRQHNGAWLDCHDNTTGKDIVCNQFPVLWECNILLGQAYSNVQSFPKDAGLVCIHFPGILGIYRLVGTVILQSVTHRLWTKLKDRVKAHLN